MFESDPTLFRNVSILNVAHLAHLALAGLKVVVNKVHITQPTVPSQSFQNWGLRKDS